MARIREAAVPETEPARDADILDAAQLADRVHLSVQTTRRLLARGVFPGTRIGRDWRVSWRAAYERIAGPGVPDGEIVHARQLARILGLPDDRKLRRAAGAPGTPGKVPGLQAGRLWLFAVEAVRAELGTLERPGLPAGADGTGS